MASLLALVTVPTVEGAVNVSWNPNPEPDIAGYIVWWGTASGAYSGSAYLGKQTVYVFAPPNPTATYYVMVQAYNTAGLTSPFSQEVIVPPSMQTVYPPVAVTGVASSIGVTSATLNGTTNPNGSATTAYFQYGPTTGYGGLTSTVSLGSGTSSIVVGGGAVSGLACGTLYHYRVLATNAAGPAAGADKTFSTTACLAPLVTTGTASSIGPTTATLSGSVNPKGWPTTAYFQYGPTTAYGAQTPGVNIGDAVVVKPAGSTLSGLSCNTVYHFRVVATSVKGTSSGFDATFTTAACQAAPPTVTTGGTNGISATGATLYGTANPNGIATTVFFQYGRTTSYGSTTSSVSAGSGSANVAMTAPVSGLACGTVYHYRIAGSNTAGTTFGGDVIFTTRSCP